MKHFSGSGNTGKVLPADPRGVALGQKWSTFHQASFRLVGCSSRPVASLSRFKTLRRPERIRWPRWALRIEQICISSGSTVLPASYDNIKACQKCSICSFAARENMETSHQGTRANTQLTFVSTTLIASWNFSDAFFNWKGIVVRQRRSWWEKQRDSFQYSFCDFDLPILAPSV